MTRVGLDWVWFGLVWVGFRVGLGTPPGVANLPVCSEFGLLSILFM